MIKKNENDDDENGDDKLKTNFISEYFDGILVPETQKKTWENFNESSAL